jgi:hypothetical protein
MRRKNLNGISGKCRSTLKRAFDKGGLRHFRVKPLLLLLVLIAPIVGLYSWFEIQQDQIRREVKWKIAEGLPDQDLTLIKLTTSEAEKSLRWKHSKEFEYQGEMYDIVRKEQKGDTLIFHCWWDYKETKLNQELAGLVMNLMGNDEQRNAQEEKLASFLKTLYCQDSFNESTTNFKWLSKSFTPYKKNYSFFSSPPPSPPPQLS